MVLSKAHLQSLIHNPRHHFSAALNSFAHCLCSLLQNVSFWIGQKSTRTAENRFCKWLRENYVGLENGCTNCVEPMWAHWLVYQCQSNDVPIEKCLKHYRRWASQLFGLRDMSVTQSPFLIRHLYLISVSLGKDQRTNIIKAHVWKRLTRSLSFIIYSTLHMNTIKRAYVPIQLRNQPTCTSNYHN